MNTKFNSMQNWIISLGVLLIATAIEFKYANYQLIAGLGLIVIAEAGTIAGKLAGGKK